MPVATPKQYAAMLDAAQSGGYAYPAINITSLPTLNGALKAFYEQKSDGIIQISTGSVGFDARCGSASLECPSVRAAFGVRR
jgi:fructose-bisphosphate aldolase class II